jgi:hypothetical protein
MNMPGNPNQMNMGLNTNQFDQLNTRMPGHVMNQQQSQQQLQPHLQQQHQATNPNLMANKGPRGMSSPQVHQQGVLGSSQSQIQQSLPASSNLASMANRSSTDTLVSSVQSSMATSSSIQTSIGMVSFLSLV